MTVITNNPLSFSLFFKERKLKVSKDIFKLKNLFNASIQRFKNSEKPSQNSWADHLKTNITNKMIKI